MFEGIDEDPDYQLVWPADVFADELSEVLRLYGPLDLRVTRVLEEAFWGDSPVLDLSRPTTWGPCSDPWSPKSSATQAEHLQILIDRAHEIPLFHAPKPYWGSAASTALVASEPDRVGARQAWASLIREFAATGYLSKAAPEECIDGDALEPVTEVLEHELAVRLGRTDLYPHVTPESWSDDDFFGQIEVFHDLVARPRSRSYHSYGDCGWHYGDYSVRCGRRLYRAKVNELLDRFRIPLRLAVEGEDVGRLVVTTDEPRRELVRRILRSDTNSNTKAHAVALFRARGATLEEKRSACIALAGLLEERRGLIKAELLTKDEGALFEIMNRFGIRHREANQRNDYDPMYLDWIFWWFLATVDLVDELAAR